MIRGSVITVNYFSATLIHRMEELVSDLSGCELIVVDNSGEFVACRPTTCVVRSGSNLGFGRGCNLGAQSASGSILLFLNPDTLASASTVQTLIDAAPQCINETIWGPSILDSTGRTPTLIRPGRMGLTFRRTYLGLSHVRGERCEVLCISGACLAIGAGLFHSLGGYCEDIFLYSEDLDLCLRAQALNARVLLYGDLIVRHVGGRSTTKVGPKLKRLMRSFNGHYRFLRGRRLSVLNAAVNAVHLASGLRI